MLANTISKSISGVLSSHGIEQKIDKAEEADKKNTDRLVKAMTDLTKHLKTVEKDQKKQLGKDRQTLGSLIGGYRDTAKKFTSPAGIAGMLADKVAHRPILGAIMGTVANKLDQREENKRKEENFVASVASGTKFGRDILKQQGEKGGLQQIAGVYKEKTRIENMVEAKKAKQAALKETGKDAGIEVDLPEPELEDLKKWEEQLKKINATLKEGLTPLEDKPSEEPSDTKKEAKKDKQDSQMSDAEADKLRKELIEAVKEGMQEAFNSASPEEKEALAKENPEKIAGILGGIEDEILKLNKSQLEELVKLNAQLEGDAAKEKESDLESKIKMMNNLPSEKKEKTEEKKSMLGTLLDAAKSLFGNPLKGMFSMVSKFIPMITGVVSSIGQMIGGLAPILGPIAALAGAGFAGVKAGGMINDAIESATGDTVGNHAYNLVDKAAGQKFGNMLGFKSDAQKQKEAEDQGVKDLVKQRLASGTKISPELAKKAKELGIEIKDEDIGTPVEVKKDENAATNIRKIDNTSEVATQKLEKSDAYMEKATEAIEKISDENESKKDEKATAYAPTVVNAPKTYNNTTQNIVRPQIRNPEPTYIRVDSKRFAF